MVDDNEADILIARIAFEASGLANPWKSFSDGKTFLAYLELIKDERVPMPALVLLDLNMPSLSGFEVLEKARRDPSYIDLPIFCMLSGSSDPDDEARAVTLGASGFVTKPANIEAYSRFFASLV